MQHLETFAAARKRPRPNARPAHTTGPTSAPDPLAALLRLVAAPVPLSELAAIAQAAGIGRATAQQALNLTLRTGTVTLASVGGVVCVVAAEVAP